MYLVIGCDIGGVIMTTNQDGNNEFVRDAVNSIKNLVIYGHTIHLISFASKAREMETRRFLALHNFFESTGLSEYNLHFTRSHQDKRIECGKFAVDIMIDDSEKVLCCLSDVVDYCILFNKSNSSFVRCNTWVDIINYINSII
jgi:hypothetical protein